MKHLLFACTDLTVSAKGQIAARQLYLNLFKGESVALVGNQNSGVESFVRYLAGEGRWKSGKVWLEGETNPAQLQKRLADRVLACSPSQSSRNTLSREITLLDYLFLMRRDGCRQLLWHRRELKRRCAFLFDQVGLRHAPDECLADLSPLERCLLDIARAWDRDAALVLLEERFEGYSKQDLETLGAVMKRCKRAHGLSFVLRMGTRGLNLLADRCLWFQDGTIRRKASGQGIQQKVLRWMTDAMPWQPDPARSGPRETILEARNLPCAKGRFTLQVRQGEALHLVDYDLQRKDQLFCILSGQVQGGTTLLFHGKPLPHGWMYHRKKYPIAVVDQLEDGALFPNMTVQENLVFPSLYRLCLGGVWLPSKHVLQTAEQEWKAPRQPMPRNLSALSGAEKLALQLESLCLLHPQVVIFRDPFVQADASGRNRLLQSFARLQCRGTAVVVLSSSHTSYLGSADAAAARWYDRLIDLEEVRP